jgi:hypothetical protein
MVGATVGAYTIMTQKNIFSADVSNPSNGLTVSTFQWPVNSPSDFPGNNLVLATQYTFGLSATSTGAYSNANIDLNISKSNGNTAAAPTDVKALYSTDGSNWIPINFVTSWAGGYHLTCTIYNGPVTQGYNVPFYVEVTFLSVGHYDVTTSATGMDA